MTATSKQLIGNHALASAVSKLRNEMIPIFFTVETHKTQTSDCMHNSRKFMEKLRPETMYCASLSVRHRGSGSNVEKTKSHTLLTTVITIDATQ
jgi:DNA-binding IclR family transcriptional regulator